MSSWIESLLDVEDMRRRCAAHAKWMAHHPEAIGFAEAWARSPKRGSLEIQDYDEVCVPGLAADGPLLAR